VDRYPSEERGDGRGGDGERAVRGVDRARTDCDAGRDDPVGREGLDRGADPDHVDERIGPADLVEMDVSG
jgi:hypothetical protein